MRFRMTRHAEDAIAERKIGRSWIRRVLRAPERKESPGDGTTHCLARIRERGNRVLRVIVHLKAKPPCVVTAFFDRRMRGKLP